MSSDHAAKSSWAIQVQALSKVYRLYDKPHHRLLQALWRGRRSYYREFNALSNLSFELARGETLGIIGRNGAGKSTLLQLICGTLNPSAGSVQVRGRVAALLELGTGFNPEFTGRENIGVNAAILGLSQADIAARLDDIVAFADIGPFIDQPVKTYSSGMYVRLAFSVAIHAQPDILIVDEALSVGDALFQAKCMARMKRMLDDGMTLLFTSHDIAAIKSVCQRVLWLESGQLRMMGATAEVTRAYDRDWIAEANRNQASGAVPREGAASDADAMQTADADRVGTGHVRIDKVALTAEGQSPANHLGVAHGDTVTLHMSLSVQQACSHLVVSCHIKNAQNQHVLGANTGATPALYQAQWQAGDRLTVAFQVSLPLHSGTYTVTALVASIADTQRYTDALFHDWLDAAASLQVAARLQFPLSDLVELPAIVHIDSMPQMPSATMPGMAADWVVLDDFFPHLLSAFRIAEYNAYLDAEPGLVIYTTSAEFGQRHTEYAQRYPGLADRVRPYHIDALHGVRLAYLNFLNNAHTFLPDLTRHRVPFVLTLYPGGGLGLNEAVSDAKLLQVLRSPLLSGLVVTQPVTQRYLQDFAAAQGLSLPPVQLVPGLVVPPHHWSPQCMVHGPYFGADKAMLDVCFVAEKYMARAENKGYPVFVEAAHALADLPNIRFHVVGSLSPDDLDVSALGDRIQFHGRLETVALQHFFAGQDMIVSPNQPGKLHPGNFDGFPTGCCVEASLSGVAMVVTDALQQNPGYAHDQDAWIVPPVAYAIEHLVRELYASPERIAQVAVAGQQASRQRYHSEAQIAPRLKLLRSLLSLSAQPPSP